MGRLIIEFETRDEAQAFLQDIDGYATVLHGNKGYTVWDEINESPDDTFYVASPTGDPRFAGWKQALSTAGVERPYPAQWYDDGE